MMVKLDDVEKLGEVGFDHWNALANQLARGLDQTPLEIVKGIIRGELMADVRPRPSPLFDRHGRRIPPQGIKGKVCDVFQAFSYEKPGYICHGALLGAYTRHFPEMRLSGAQFEERAEELTRQIRQDELLANLLEGVCLPIVMPRDRVQYYGMALHMYLLAASKAYFDFFPGRTFSLSHQASLAGKIKVIHRSRHAKLVERMAEGPVVCLFFPAALQGFSVEAALEQMDSLPEGFLLAGGLDTTITLQMYPKVIGRDQEVPYLMMSAISWETEGTTPFLSFSHNSGQLVGKLPDKKPSANYTSGLLYIGTD